MIRPLIWKEWQEQRWKLAFGCVLMLGYTAIGFRTRILRDIEIIISSLVLGSIFLPIFVSLGLVAAERSAGTLKGLLSLPVKPSKVFIVKTAVGALVCIIPILCSAVLACLMTRGREEHLLSILGAYTAIAGLGLVVLIWTSSLSLWCRSEDKVGIVGMALLVVYSLHAIIVDEFRLDKTVGEWVWALNPFSIIELLDYRPGILDVLTVAIAQLVLAIILWVWAMRRFGSISRKPL